MQWVPCKVNVTPFYFARSPLRSYFHDPQKNEVYFLNIRYQNYLDKTDLPGVTLIP